MPRVSKLALSFRFALRISAVAVFAATLPLGGCDLSKYSVSSSSASASEQLNGGCTTKATSLVGTVPAGGACEKAEECAPTCCPCSSGKRAWMAALCSNKVCAPGADACAKTDDPKNCK
jgi:hypothetical protein